MADVAVTRLRDALGGDVERTQIEAALELPETAADAAPILEDALDAAPPRVEVALLDALTRVAASHTWIDRLVAILDSPGAQGDLGEELYMMARIALALADDEPIDAEGATVRVLGVGESHEKMAIVIHGTWASDGTWWRKGGDFHDYLLDDLGMEWLYPDDEPFIWSGKNRDSQRHKGADALIDWCAKNPTDELEVYAHSHGANVAMLATRMGLEISRLVMLSPPVRDDYLAAWANVGPAFNVQADWDPVVAIARGGDTFDAGLPVIEVRLEADGHSASHDPEVWKNEGVPAKLGIV